MPQNNSNSPPPVSPELKRLQEPGQGSIRNFLRTAGLVLLLAGGLCEIGGFISFFSAFGGSGPPRFFWLAFVGMPLLFLGVVFCMFGFMGAVTRFMAGETAPVAVDAAKYAAEETQGAVETVAKAAAKGVVEGIEAGRGQAGGKNDAAAQNNEGK